MLYAMFVVFGWGLGCHSLRNERSEGVIVRGGDGRRADVSLLEDRPFFCRAFAAMPVPLPSNKFAPTMLPRLRRRAMMRIEVVFALAVLVLSQITQAFTSWRSPAHDVPHSHKTRVRKVDVQQSSSVGREERRSQMPDKYR